MLYVRSLCSDVYGGFLSAAHSQVSWQHPAATVLGHVPRERGQRGNLPNRHEEHVQPQTGCAQEVRPEGEEVNQPSNRTPPGLFQATVRSSNQYVFFPPGLPGGP